MISIRDWQQFFPFAEPNGGQVQAIDFILNSFLVDNKKFCVAELATGHGKSAVAITVARFLQAKHEIGDAKTLLGGAYFLTTQKILQEQYVNDFGNSRGNLKLMKSSSGYVCQFYEDTAETTSCGEIQRLIKSKASCSVIYDLCKETCKFRTAKEEFLSSPEGITNYAYFLTTSTYTKEIEKRNLLILDEGHNVDTALGSFVKIAFSNFFYKTILGVKTPGVGASQATVYKWLVEICKPRLAKVVRDMQKKVGRSADSTEAIQLSKRLEELKRSMSRIEQFIETYDPSTWVLDVSKSDKRGERIYEFKPVDVGMYAKTMLYAYADRVLVLSATILDKEVFCKSVGIEPEEASFLRIPSPFQASNKPVHYMPVGSMSKNNIESTLPKMVEAVKMLLDQHHNEKGIIHCVNHTVAKYLVANINSTRLLTHDTSNREQVLTYHYQSEEPTVLVSPSMMEGVDLAGDKSRFQIVCKVPFPYIGDAAVKLKMQRDHKWYAYQTVKTVVQALGRSVRNETDYAVSYILDSDWERFYKTNVSMFPLDFSETLV